MKYWNISLLVVLLSACQQSNHINQPNTSANTVATNPVEQTGIVKSKKDSRLYQAMMLDNGLEVMLVSDPSIEKSAAALSVAAGSLQEPEAFGGLAHYLEHMLFLGTKTYPDVNEYNEFISRNGGSENAYTELDHTNYMVSVNNDAYGEALKRFSRFFYEALLDEQYADKERNAVHSEWSQKGPNDWVIMGQLDGYTLNPDHPISQFNWGNLESLADKDNQKLQDLLVDFYNKYYSANLMKAVMISHLPLAQMQKLAKDNFGKITNKNTPKPVITKPVAQSEQLKKIVHYVPQTDMKQLQVKFVINDNSEQFAVKPNFYLRYLLSNEMPGTLASTLRELGYTENLWASSNPSEYGNAGSFTIYATLTETGLKNRNSIVGAIFDYLALIKAQGIDAKYFKEIKQSLSNSFQFKEKIDDYSYAMQIAANLQDTPASYVLSSDYEYQRFNSAAINAVLEQLTLDNARIFYIDKAQPTNTEMDFFVGKYQVESITKEISQQWQKASEEINLSLPSPNTLMPENFDIETAQYIDKPKTLINEQGLNVYLAHSKHFTQPKGSFSANFNSGFDKESPRNHVLAALLSDGLRMDLTALSSEASAAGMRLNVGSYNGLYLTASGFTNKQQQLLANAYQSILNYQVSSAQLDNLKASYISGIESKQKYMLLNQLFPQFNKIVNLDEFSDTSLLAEVASITPNELLTFRDQLLNKAKLNIFAFGNYNEEQVIKTAKYLESLLPKSRQVSDIYFTKTFKPTKGTVINWQQDVDMNDIAVGDFYMAPFEVKQYAAAQVLQKVLKPALFNQIRTEEQLAYSVGFFSQALREQILLGFYIQSPAKGPAAVIDRIAAFRHNFTTELAELSAEEFDTIRKSVLISLTQPPKNLAEESSAFVSDWRKNKLSFDSKAKLISAIKSLELADIKHLYQQLNQDNAFGRVMVQMRGKNFKDQPFVEPDNVKQITDVNDFHHSISQ
ncbi:insulinase family protein [Colwellia sp. RSH04]|uniref:insulinase family protein n=1 Tax=Colwellia sp. RSH04 TaxID=2305464 RepID=UPI000E56C427|nr:insulinase family protein [Colwellia sp. RSH04]RHW75831.1 peptidase M16 [Colwellia sp. RSH04]